MLLAIVLEVWMKFCYGNDYFCFGYFACAWADLWVAMLGDAVVVCAVFRSYIWSRLDGLVTGFFLSWFSICHGSLIIGSIVTGFFWSIPWHCFGLEHYGV